jgi:hypothetical protein
MIVDDNKSQGHPRPPRGLPATAPPGFIRREGRSFILVGAEKLGRLVGLRRDHASNSAGNGETDEIFR